MLEFFQASSLEFELRELKFHHLHKTKGLNVAVEYGKSFVSSYIAEHDYVKSKFPNYGNQHIQRTNVNRMMASLLWNKRGGNSPYKTYFDMHQQLQSTCEKFKREYLLNHRFQSALHAVVSAGSMALLVLLGISSKVQVRLLLCLCCHVLFQIFIIFLDAEVVHVTSILLVLFLYCPSLDVTLSNIGCLCGI